MTSALIPYLSTTLLWYQGLAARTTGTLYHLSGTGVRMETADLLASTAAPTTLGCARLCTSRPGCACFGTLAQAGGDSVECHLSLSVDPGLVASPGARIYRSVSLQDAQTSTLQTPDLTTTTESPATTTADTPPSTADPATCTDPAVTQAPHDCSGTPTFSAAAVMKLGSNRAVVFTTNATYIRCSGMNNIVQQGAKYCEGPYTLAGDSGLDPGSSRFASGPPDGGVSYIHSNMADCQYYLFKGDNVYCYEHSDTHTAWMKYCVGTWTVKTIQERFGAGIPSAPDDVIGNFLTTFDFYFLKDNIVYKSSGDISSGSLAVGYPKLIHEEFPNLVCDVTGVTLGLNPGEMYMLVGEYVYQEQGSTVYYKGTLCHST